MHAFASDEPRYGFLIREASLSEKFLIFDSYY
jgi:hypothetical protein